MTDADRRRTAYQESGHTLVGMLTPGADPVPKESRRRDSNPRHPGFHSKGPTARPAGEERRPAAVSTWLFVPLALLLLDLVARGGEDVPLRAELIEVLPVRIAGLLVRRRRCRGDGRCRSPDPGRCCRSSPRSRRFRPWACRWRSRRARCSSRRPSSYSRWACPPRTNTACGPAGRPGSCRGGVPYVDRGARRRAWLVDGAAAVLPPVGIEEACVVLLPLLPPQPLITTTATRPARGIGF